MRQGDISRLRALNPDNKTIKDLLDEIELLDRTVRLLQTQLNKWRPADAYSDVYEFDASKSFRTEP